MADQLLILDFGSQYTQLIARRVRELNVYCEIHPFNKVTDALLADFAPKAVILSGGPASVFSDGALVDRCRYQTGDGMRRRAVRRSRRP